MIRGLAGIKLESILISMPVLPSVGLTVPLVIPPQYFNDLLSFPRRLVGDRATAAISLSPILRYP
jgi:hypothetical protein